MDYGLLTMSLLKFLFGLILIFQLHAGGPSVQCNGSVFHSITSQQSLNTFLSASQISLYITHFSPFPLPQPSLCCSYFSPGLWEYISRLTTIRVQSRVVTKFTKFIFHLFQQCLHSRWGIPMKCFTVKDIFPTIYVVSIKLISLQNKKGWKYTDTK